MCQTGSVGTFENQILVVSTGKGASSEARLYQLNLSNQAPRLIPAAGMIADILYHRQIDPVASEIRSPPSFSATWFLKIISSMLDHGKSSSDRNEHGHAKGSTFISLQAPFSIFA